MAKASDIAEEIKTALAAYPTVSSGGWTVERTWLPEMTREKAAIGHIAIVPLSVEVARESRSLDMHLYQVDVHICKVIADMTSVSEVDGLVAFGETIVDFLCNLQMSVTPIERVEQVPLWSPEMVQGQTCFATTIQIFVRDVR